jgi:hypothetical protein
MSRAKSATGHFPRHSSFRHNASFGLDDLTGVSAGGVRNPAKPIAGPLGKPELELSRRKAPVPEPRESRDAEQAFIGFFG